MLKGSICETFLFALLVKSRRKFDRTYVFSSYVTQKQSWAHGNKAHFRPAPGPGKVLLPSAFSSPVHAACARRALSRSWGQLRDRRRRTPGAQVSGGPFVGDERAPTGTRTPSPPFLLCETELPNPSLSYLSICMYSDLILI